MAVKDDIQELLSRYAGAVRGADVGAVVDCFTSDAVVMAPAVPTAVGRDGVKALYGQIFTAVTLDISFTVDLVVDADQPVALTHSTGTQTDVSSGAGSPEANREAFVFRRDGGALKISHYLFNTVA